MIQRVRRDELLEQAAEASRTGLRTRQQRIEASARPILHSAVAAALAWLIATEVVGHEQPFFAPTRRCGRLERYAVAAGQLGRAIEDVRALARSAMRAINVDDSVPPEAVQAIDELVAGARSLTDYLDGDDAQPVHEAAVRAAALANAVLESTGNLSAVHIVGQIRLIAVDLLRATGLPRPEAQQAVRGARLT